MAHHHEKRTSTLAITFVALLTASCGPPPAKTTTAAAGYTTQPAAVEPGAPGAPCNTFRDCQSQACVRGVCAAPAPLTPSGATSYAQACSTDSDCAPPSYCILGTCRPLGQQGEACTIDVDCVEPLMCAGGTCSAPGGIGEPCKSFMHCMAPLACVSGACAQCTISGISSTVGTPCCDDSNCTGDLYCIMSTCRPMGGHGCQCGIDDDCDSLACENGQCIGGGPCWENQQTQGGACAHDDDCMPPLVCIKSACRPMGDLGDPCASFADCVAPLACEKGLCAECVITGVSSVFGTPCCDDANCTGDLYCIMGACRPIGQQGDACAVDMDCDSDYCLNGTCRP